MAQGVLLGGGHFTLPSQWAGKPKPSPCKRSLAIRKKAVGPEHPDVALSPKER